MSNPIFDPFGLLQAGATGRNGRTELPLAAEVATQQRQAPEARDLRALRSATGSPGEAVNVNGSCGENPWEQAWEDGQ